MSATDASAPLAQLETISRWGVQLALIVDGGGQAPSGTERRLHVSARNAGCGFAQGAFYGPPADPGDLLPGLVTGHR
jgi:hypothetical protein